MTPKSKISAFDLAYKLMHQGLIAAYNQKLSTFAIEREAQRRRLRNLMPRCMDYRTKQDYKVKCDAIDIYYEAKCDAAYDAFRADLDNLDDAHEAGIDGLPWRTLTTEQATVDELLMALQRK